MNIFISTSTFGEYSSEPLELLKRQGIAFQLNPLGRTLSEEEAVDFLRDKDGVIAGTEPLTRKVVENSPSLRVISRVGTGLDNVDREAAAERGIQIFNTPEGPTLAVAELTVGLILSVLRKIAYLDRKIRQGEWKKKMGSLLSGKTVGVIGFGNIGQKLAKLLQVFQCEILFYDPFVQVNVSELSVKQTGTLDELLQLSDVVTLHLPYCKENHHFLDKKRLSLLKSGAIVINAARGGLVDESALFDLLQNGRLAGAALDVFEQEPYQGRLKQLDNVVLTPHVGSYAKESRVRMELDAVLNLFKGLGIE